MKRNKRPLAELIVEVILDDLQTDCQGKWNRGNPFFYTQQYTSGTHSHILTYRSWCETTKVIPNYSMDHFRGKFNLISRKSNDKYGRYHHIQNIDQFPNFRTGSKIYQMVHWELLPINTHGTVIIYEDTYQVISARYHRALQLKWLSQSRWMDLHGNYTRNVWTTTSRNSCKQLTHTTFKQPRIL